MRYFDPRARRLIYLGGEATPGFWDAHWQGAALAAEKILALRDTFVTRETRRYLRPEDGVILEGGCGRAQHVAALTNRGYRCTGIEFAPATVAAINRHMPSLDVRLGDVRALPFPDGSLAGYWSLGLIEHFWEGYEPIIREAARVLRPGGYLFLTFPVLSPLRRVKARLRRYPAWHSSEPPDGFYQFALSQQAVLETVAPLGLRLVEARPFDGIKGTKSEIPLLSRPLQWLYDYRGRNPAVRALRAALTHTLAPVAGHSLLLVLQREDP